MRAPAGIVSGIGRDGGRTHFSGTFGRSTVELCLPFNPSRYSEDRLRPFVKVVGPWLRGTPLWSHRRKAEEDR
jgi:hypothetical protein